MMLFRFGIYLQVDGVDDVSCVVVATYILNNFVLPIGLFYRMLASYGNVVGNTKSRRGAKAAKDRLTVGITWNATGTDFWKPIFIVKSKRPRCFRRL